MHPGLSTRSACHPCFPTRLDLLSWVLGSALVGGQLPSFRPRGAIGGAGAPVIRDRDAGSRGRGTDHTFESHFLVPHFLTQSGVENAV